MKYVLAVLFLPRSIACLILLVCTTFIANAQQATTEIMQVSFSRSGENAIVEYSREHELLGPDQALTVHVFGDGKVSVVIPSAYSQSGNYFFALEPQELDRLVNGVAPGIMAAQNNSAALVIAEASSNFLISDQTHTKIQLNFDTIESSDGQIISTARPMQVVESNLGLWSRQTPSLSYRQSLLDIETMMLSLANDSRRRPE